MFVDKPWPVPYLFVPKESTVEINCTARERSYSPFWLIDLANDTKNFSLQFINQEEQLSAHSVYQLPLIETPGMPPTLRLYNNILINDTVWNNQTKIQCNRSATSESNTTLFVVGKVFWFIITMIFDVTN